MAGCVLLPVETESPRKSPVPKMAYSMAETAAALGITKPTAYKLVAQGRLRTVMVGARRLVPITEIERLLAGSR
jgi:excisionase family DNA binding protein